MAKIPAFLFYSQDFLIGCADLTMEERGQYITLLCLQHQKGHLSEKAIQLGIGLPPEKIPDVMRKFVTDPEGLFYNKRLELESDNRSKFIQHQRDNINKRWHPDESDQSFGKRLVNTKGIPLENENENENENRNKKMNNENEKKENKESLKDQKIRLLTERKKLFVIRISEFRGKYPDEMLNKFYDYWSEMNKSGSQMRWEMEKTWELARRLKTWADRDRTFQKPDELITHKELLDRFNKGESDIWETHEQVKLNGKVLWKRKKITT